MLKLALHMRRALLQPPGHAQRQNQLSLRCAPARMLWWRALGRKSTARQRSCGGGLMLESQYVPS